MRTICLEAGDHWLCSSHLGCVECQLGVPVRVSWCPTFCVPVGLVPVFHNCGMRYDGDVQAEYSCNTIHLGPPNCSITSAAAKY